MITRSYDANALNAVLNHPKVLPWVTLPGVTYLDSSSVIEDRRNYLLEATDGFFLGTYEEPGIYEVHTQFYPWAKLKQTVADGYSAIEFMFKTDCTELVTRVPQNNKAADWFARRMGFKFYFTNKSVWPTTEGLVDLTFYRLFKCPQ